MSKNERYHSSISFSCFLFYVYFLKSNIYIYIFILFFKYFHSLYFFLSYLHLFYFHVYFFLSHLKHYYKTLRVNLLLDDNTISLYY